ncbi:hypothetical protein TorRG33x02_029970 [Trema orientale]|uniref:DUF4283 domain-containing protein n=1 Tax=Trema orientale TaxID=63057 RepID=A0A2P5FTX0_TREOI|nr:hypothetical protein TorRG33x02_029970 [Trema orientale]
MDEPREIESSLEVDEIDEVRDQVKNLYFDDLSLELEPDEESRSEVILKSLVGHFMTHKQVFNGLLRDALGRIWNPAPGWKMQDVAKYTFIFSFTTRKEVYYILGNRPWSLCNGFLVITEMPNDGLWGSADLSITPL